MEQKNKRIKNILLIAAIFPHDFQRNFYLFADKHSNPSIYNDIYNPLCMASMCSARRKLHIKYVRTKMMQLSVHDVNSIEEHIKMINYEN